MGEDPLIQGLVLIIFALAIMWGLEMSDGEESPDLPALEAGNHMVLACMNAETTLSKSNCIDASVGKVLVFSGLVTDITADQTLTVYLSDAEFAEVDFTYPVSHEVRKDDHIRFRGKFTGFGSGMITSHDIEAATLLPPPY